MSTGLYLCVLAPEFPAQALLRLRTDLQTEAVVVMDGRAPQEWVCAMNRLAERKGAAVGMTRFEAESVNGLRLLKRSAENEAAAQKVFLECAAKFSPRIEEANDCDGFHDVRQMTQRSPISKSRPGTPMPTEYALVLDIAGTERLFGPPQRLAERLRDELAEAGFRVAITVSANYEAARMKAAGIRGVAVIAEGNEAESLAKLPITALGLDEEIIATLVLWGINTLGELAALPESELVARLGPEAQRWRALACGAAEHAFVPIEPAFLLEEFCEFETPVEQIDSLLFVGARMIDCLVARAGGRALALTSLKAEMRLEGDRTHNVAIKPALPSADRKFLLKLLQLEIGAHPPQAAVVSLTLRADAGQQGKVQLGLFAPQTPEPSRLDVTLARLRALVGEERVGSPVLEDSHRSGAFRMEEFRVEQASESASKQVSSSTEDHHPRMALRRVRPARPVRVLVSPSVTASALRKTIAGIKQTALRPVSFRDGERAYAIETAYGPWRTSGCWWAVDAWDTEEWDVLAVSVEQLAAGAKAPNPVNAFSTPVNSYPDTSCLPEDAVRKKNFTRISEGAMIACLLVHDRTRNSWRLEAIYD